jgi:hypothetical protein
MRYDDTYPNQEYSQEDGCPYAITGRGRASEEERTAYDLI